MTEASPPRRKYAHTYIKPKQRIGEREKLDRHWRKLFLDTLAETSNVSEAARVAEINPSRAYKVRRAEPGFRRQWNAALIEGYEHLEMETLHRLRAGTGKDVLARGRSWLLWSVKPNWVRSRPPMAFKYSVSGVEACSLRCCVGMKKLPTKSSGASGESTSAGRREGRTTRREAQTKARASPSGGSLARR